MSKRKEKYLKYLNSKEWAATRNDVVLMYKGVCQDCLTLTKSPQVHHLTYANLYHEEPEDLILLCRQCHRKRHGIDNKNIKRKSKQKKRKLTATSVRKRIIKELKFNPGKSWSKMAKSVAWYYTIKPPNNKPKRWLLSIMKKKFLIKQKQLKKKKPTKRKVVYTPKKVPREKYILRKKVA